VVTNAVYTAKEGEILKGSIRILHDCSLLISQVNPGQICKKKPRIIDIRENKINRIIL